METQARRRGATVWVARVGLALAVVGLLMELVSGWGYQRGWWGLGFALRDLFGYGGIAAAAGCVVSLIAVASARLARSGGAAPGAIGFVIGLVPGLLFYHQYRLARSVPPVNDITTDVTNPPAYVTAAANEFWQGKDLSFPVKWADTVRTSYPDLTPLVLPVSAGRAFALARRTAEGMSGWAVTAADSAGGRIEATATTRWFGFKDDVVIRLAPRGADSAVVDMRSKSRVGRSDVGANAARIRQYFAALRKAAAAR